MSGAGEHTDILSVVDVVRDRWKVVREITKSCLKKQTDGPMKRAMIYPQPHVRLTINIPFFSGKEDRWRRVWRDLRGFGSVEPGHCCLKGGVCSATQTGAEDGGGCAKEASG